MSNKEKVVSLADRKIRNAYKEIDQKRLSIDEDIPPDDLMDEAIQQAIENGDTTLHSLTKVVLKQAEALDKMEDTLSKILAALRVEVDLRGIGEEDNA